MTSLYSHSQRQNNKTNSRMRGCDIFAVVAQGGSPTDSFVEQYLSPRCICWCVLIVMSSHAPRLTPCPFVVQQAQSQRALSLSCQHCSFTLCLGQNSLYPTRRAAIPTLGLRRLATSLMLQPNPASHPREWDTPPPPFWLCVLFRQ